MSAPGLIAARPIVPDRSGSQTDEVFPLISHQRLRQHLRIPAYFIATLYALLCICGPLTHSHVFQGGDDFAASVASQIHASSSHVPIALQYRSNSAHPIHASHCPYCEWKANCLSAALVNLQVPHLTLKSVYAFPLTGDLHSRFILHFSSRGPPVA